MTTGTYSTAGDNVSTSPSGGTVGTPSGYCVRGSQLRPSLGTPGHASTNTYLLFTEP